MSLSRRGLFGVIAGAIAAPYVARAGVLMPVRSIVEAGPILIESVYTGFPMNGTIHGGFATLGRLASADEIAAMERFLSRPGYEIRKTRLNFPTYIDDDGVEYMRFE